MNIQTRGFEHGVIHLKASHSGLISEVLSAMLSLTPERVLEILYLGGIYLFDKRQHENLHINTDDYLRIHTRPRRYNNPQDWAQRIVFQNDDFIVVNKPAGLPCYASVDNEKENVLMFLREHLQAPVLTLHRLDVPTQGLLCLAKTLRFQQSFNELLKDRRVQKLYTAHVASPGPELGEHTHYMEKSPWAPKVARSQFFTEGLECRLRVLEKSEVSPGVTALKIELLTGRTHQIRCQMAAMGFPLRGDHLYGAERIYAEERIDLWASDLSFADPFSAGEKNFAFSLT